MAEYTATARPFYSVSGLAKQWFFSGLTIPDASFGTSYAGTGFAPRFTFTTGFNRNVVLRVFEFSAAAEASGTIRLTQGRTVIDLDIADAVKTNAGTSSVTYTWTPGPLRSDRAIWNVLGSDPVTILIDVPLPLGTMYMTGTQRDAFYSLDRETGIVTRIGSANQFGLNITTPGDLTWDGTNLYMLDLGLRFLTTVDRDTGVATRVGSATRFGLSSSETLSAIAWDGSTLYAGGTGLSRFRRAEARLYTLDRTTGRATRVGSVANMGFNLADYLVPLGLEWDGTNLYVSLFDQNSGLKRYFATVNRTTGVATRIDSFTSSNPFGIRGSREGNVLAWDGQNLFYAIGSRGSFGAVSGLYTLDRTTGQATLVGGSRDFNGSENWPTGLAFVPQAPDVTPSWTQSSGRTLTGSRGVEISTYTVPAVDAGSPAPTYAVVGSLPNGLSFTPSARVLTGTPTAAVSGNIIIRATNTAGTADYTIPYVFTEPQIAPSWSDPTGDPITSRIGVALSNIVIPAAAGFPAPTYSVPSRLPNGLMFNSNTRTLSGTPTDFGSGTIRIRATNDAGTADYTIAYNFLSLPSWEDTIVVPDLYANHRINSPVQRIVLAPPVGNPQPTVTAPTLPTGLTFDVLSNRAIAIAGTPTQIGSGNIVLRATNSQGTTDLLIPYSFVTDLFAPSWTQPIGDALSVFVNSAIPSTIIPAASANPAATYSVVGSLPTGLLFDTSTRTLSGTPTVVSSGTITIRATNSEGTADYTIAYNFSAAPTPPNFDPNNVVITGRAAVPLTPYTMPAASGTPPITYQLFGHTPEGQSNLGARLPPDLSFDADSRTLSGTPQSAGMGRIDIRATNAQGIADFLIYYEFAAAFSAPRWVDDTGDVLDGQAHVAITPVVIPEPSAEPAPTYSVVGALPAGLAFDPDTRTLSGTPTVSGEGVIRIRATNTVGIDDYTIAYDFEEHPQGLALDGTVVNPHLFEFALRGEVLGGFAIGDTVLYEVPANRVGTLRFTQFVRSITAVPGTVDRHRVSIHFVAQVSDPEGIRSIVRARLTNPNINSLVLGAVLHQTSWGRPTGYPFRRVSSTTWECFITASTTVSTNTLLNSNLSRETVLGVTYTDELGFNHILSVRDR